MIQSCHKRLVENVHINVLKSKDKWFLIIVKKLCEILSEIFFLPLVEFMIHFMTFFENLKSESYLISQNSNKNL